MFAKTTESAIPIYCLEAAGLPSWLAQTSTRDRHWLSSNGFHAQPGRTVLMPDDNGQVSAVLVGREQSDRMWALAQLPGQLPDGDYRLAGQWCESERELLSIGWALGGYRFDRYKPVAPSAARLVLPESIAWRVQAQVNAIVGIRDLVNTPANDLGPDELANQARRLAERHTAAVEVISGERLAREFPAIHAVGQASARPPCLIRLQWGEPDAPPLALVGKGVIFDSGGLDIKPSAGMLLMKKDMGGAAHALGLAGLIMELGLAVNLRVYIPAVENAIAGNAYRPSDIIRTRQGITVEIGNTDAEGRVVLADALTLACQDGAERIIDFATLTGAARVALGEDLPPLYARNTEQARAIQDRSFELHDPLWHMPLFDGYRAYIRPAIADLTNSSSNKFAGSLTAALFLDHFVDTGLDWLHLDIYAWNLTDRPGRPAGGEAQGVRTLLDWLENQYGRAET